MAGLLISNDGSRFEWTLGALAGGLSAYYRVLRPDRSVEAEEHIRPVASREEALSWLRRAARARGFDARGIK